MMAFWHEAVKLKDLLGEDDDPAMVRRVAREVFDRLEEVRQRAYPDDLELDSICAEFEAMADAKADDDAVEWFNVNMENLYDWGNDGHRLWID